MQTANPLTPPATLQRLDAGGPAGLWITSLPWPRQAATALSLNGRAAHCQPLGAWPDTGEPRRLLLIADGNNSAPDSISIDGMPTGELTGELPCASLERFARNSPDELAWEQHTVRVTQGGRSVELALGLRTGGEVHWWEACRLVVLGKSSHCVEIEVGGAISHRLMTAGDSRKYIGYHNPYLHKHNWLNGVLYLRLHRNGVCEVYAHHINSKFFDDGRDLEDVAPVIGFRTQKPCPFAGNWDGTLREIELNDVRFDLSAAADLATPTQPGAFENAGEFVAWQPYTGAELYGGVCPKELTGDPFVFHAERRVFPKGMARTVRFSFSLTDRSPRIARYQAPAWWYGVCEELASAPLLPADSAGDPQIARALEWVRRGAVSGGFEDGSLPRHFLFEAEAKGRLRNEPGWEGELPYALFLNAWQSGRGDDHSLALRAAYYFTDVAVDHTSKLVRMHGYPPNAYSLPMNRMQATIAAYLETGDPYLLRTAEAVVTSAHWQHLNSWPRLAVGRDGCYVRSAVLLYRYFGRDYFREIAHAGCLTILESQRANGSFGDQGGGAGIHQWGGYITKPWMGLLALNGVLDYLELFPDEERMADGVRRFADWLMAERWFRNGMMTWSYQHDYDGARTFYCPNSGKTFDLPGEDPWHQETLARLLGYAAMRFDDARYLEAWAESSRTCNLPLQDHPVAAILQFLPWLHARLWNVRFRDGALCAAPVYFGEKTPRSARFLTPDGPVELAWNGHAEVVAPDKVSIPRCRHLDRPSCQPQGKG